MQAPTKVRAGVIGASLAFILVVQWLAIYPELVDKYYSNGLYPILTLFISGITGHFAFSVSEFSVWFTLLILLPAFISRLWSRKMTIGRGLLNITMGLSVIVVWFYLFWGINYMRQPLLEKLSLDQVQLKMDAFDSTFVDIIRQTNKLNPNYGIQAVDEINRIVETSYKGVLDSLGLKRIPGPQGIKTLASNWILNKTTTSGFFSPFFHEVHYNDEMLVIELPFVIAHEKAHQMGYTSEGEANFLAYLVCINSEDPLVRYSGYFNVLGYFLQATGRDNEKRKFFAERLSQGVKLDLQAVRERWKSHRGAISRIADSSYDLYLKANQVKGGMANYSSVVDLIIRYVESKEESDG